MVLTITIIIAVLFALWGAIAPDQLASVADRAYGFSIQNFGWFYLIATLFFLVFALYLAFSRFGNIRLGDDDDEPEYSTLSWLSMLFSAGMGIGLVFWGVAEPLSHYLAPPEGAVGGTVEAARLAMRYSFFHWGLHPWAIYAVIALALAYFQFRKNYKGLVSSTFIPLLGERVVNGWVGKAIDILAVLATVFGVATSLGLGALQINGGLNHLFGVADSTRNQVIIILIVTVLFLISASTGLNKGIKILSNTNLVIAVLLMLFVWIAGPTAFIFDTFTTTLGNYVQNIIVMSLRLTPFSQGAWVGMWTLFYWAWWIAWAPFVGTFIARVSKGRTIKEFVIYVMLVPSAFGFIWFSVFGGTGLHQELFDLGNVAQAVKENTTTALFITLEHLPLGAVIAFIATLLIMTFFITSADSATFVLGMLTSDGTLNPTLKVKMTWGILQSFIAIVLLLSGGLSGLQTASIVAALPFALVLIGMCFSLLRALQMEDKERRRKEKRIQQKLRRMMEAEENGQA
ncbi:BCCT family transporter [Paenibacillus sp. F411]|uniref:Choline/carnitine/betaine transporter n=1 Tax=Paenibacillus algicola TaxID=2565926 RepID=A0A4P8XKX0_9BACL|nr:MULTISPECIES: BCCT family transporter [Paenibacillus]MBO2942662.1 BCCT family transporter [Paenibacillus sp. F411]QCT03397.1 choline/carnitine/betaine transporter [Paenibacillus algicola]